MPSATLNWTELRALPAVVTTGPSALWDSFRDGIQILDDASDFPWVTCHVETASAEAHYVVLKRKTGAPGRIVMGLNKNSTTFNPSIQFDFATPSTDSLFAFYVEGATSDAPTNLKGSGALFTGEDLVNSTPIGFDVSIGETTSKTPYVAANEDAVILMVGRFNGTWSPQNGVSAMLGAGGLLVDDSDTPHNAVVRVDSTSNSTITLALHSSEGFLHRRTPTGELELWAPVPSMSDSVLSTKVRNEATKKIWFVPITLASQQAISGDRSFYYTVRQMGYSAPPLAAREELRDGSGSLKATCASAYVGSALWFMWLCNFKLNV